MENEMITESLAETISDIGTDALAEAQPNLVWDINKIFILVGIPMALAGLYHLYKAYVIYLLKVRCTKEISATLTNLRVKSGINNANAKQYNATYKFEYNNAMHKEHNEIWAAIPAKEKSLSEGDHITLMIDPNNPKDFIDPIALYNMKSHIKTGIVLLSVGMISILWSIIKPALLGLAH